MSTEPSAQGATPTAIAPALVKAVSGAWVPMIDLITLLADLDLDAEIRDIRAAIDDVRAEREVADREAAENGGGHPRASKPSETTSTPDDHDHHDVATSVARAGDNARGWSR